jgi:N-acetylglucosamine-6-sulfatase
MTNEKKPPKPAWRRTSVIVGIIIAFSGIAIALITTVLGANGATNSPSQTVPTTVPQVSKALTRPNILLILTDDQNTEAMRAMSYLRGRPYGGWISFPNAFINTPLCCPSRATLLSGQYSSHHQVRDNSRGAAFNDRSTVATWLDAGGYRTGLIGKYLNGYPYASQPANYVPPGWDTWAAFSGGERYYDYTLNVNGTPASYRGAAQDYSTDVLTNRALGFIRDPSTRPFFLYLAYKAPHSRFVPAPRHATAFSSTVMPHPPNFNEADVSDKPAWVRSKALRTQDRINAFDSDKRNAWRTLLAVDESIKRLLDALSANGKLNNTVVVVMTDNGRLFGEHRLGDKTMVYEEAVRTPFLVRYPGAANRTDQRLVSNVDLASTFADLADATPTRSQDGASLVPLLEGQQPGWRTGVLLQWVGSSRVPAYNAIREAAWKYVELATGERELYDLNADPYELQNVAGRSAYATQQQRLAEQLHRLLG